MHVPNFKNPTCAPVTVVASVHGRDMIMGSQL